MTGPVHGSDVFIRADVYAILQSIMLANEAALRASGGNSDYAAGHGMALMQVAYALGLGRQMANFRREMEWEAANGETR